MKYSKRTGTHGPQKNPCAYALFNDFTIHLSKATQVNIIHNTICIFAFQNIHPFTFMQFDYHKTAPQNITVSTLFKMLINQYLGGRTASNTSDTSFRYFAISICWGQLTSHFLHPMQSDAFPNFFI